MSLPDPNQLVRLTDAAYGDGFSSLATGADPVAIAQGLFSQTGDLRDPMGLSELFVSWGQFIDHDLSLTPDASGEHVPVPGLMGPLERSVFDPQTGTTGPREQLNVITPGIDGSMVYGSDQARIDAVRSFDGGRLRVSDDPTSALGLLPETNGEAMAGDNDPDNPVFLAGDVRANENTGLTLLHTLFVREHNHWADRLASENPDWTDEQIFEAARSIVEVELQQITYRDWLPHLVGDATDTITVDASDPIRGGQISTEFSTAAFRFGHTMVSSSIPGIAADGATTLNLTVQDQFFNVDVIKTNGIADLLRGQAVMMAQALDTQVIDDLNFFLQLASGAAGFSLPALNIVRNRDHGIDTYVNVRAQLLGDIDPDALDPADFSVITSDTALQAELAQVYASVHQVGLWVGGLAEDKIPGTQMGATFTHIIADQFARTRDADITFGTLDPALGAEIQAEVANTTLADILNRVGEAEGIQADPFKAMTRMVGTDERDVMSGSMDGDLMMGHDGHDQLRGRSGDDDLQGNDGFDKLFGQLGDDRLDGGEGRDILCGHGGEDILIGGADNDHLNGGRDDDMLFGGTGKDRMRGGWGDDTLDGGAGLDRMIGDDGVDTFVFATGNETDMVLDFQAGTDLLDVSGSTLADFADVEANSREAGRWLIIQDGEDRLMLRDVDLADLTPDSFLF